MQVEEETVEAFVGHPGGVVQTVKLSSKMWINVSVGLYIQIKRSILLDNLTFEKHCLQGLGWDGDENPGSGDHLGALEITDTILH